MSVKADKYVWNFLPEAETIDLLTKVNLSNTELKVYSFFGLLMYVYVAE